MAEVHLKVARIGNSRGVRLPAGTLTRYRIGERVIMEERSDGILLRPQRSGSAKLDWRQTARAMAAELEDWSAWESVAGDGLKSAPWSSTTTPGSGIPRRRGPRTRKRAN